MAIAGALWFRSPSTSADAATAPVATVAFSQLGELTVYVSGEVAAPGLVALPAGSRVADAIVAAGGALSAADMAALNLAAPVRDGEHVVVGPASEGLAGAVAVEDGLVHLNIAGVSDLERLPGVGPVLAARIASFRDQNGPFDLVEDLLDVPGIGEAKLAALRDAVAIP